MDVQVSRRMRARPAEVAAVMFDPDRDPEWIGGARSVEVLSPDPHGAGARIRRAGRFLGRRFSWVTELTEFVPDRLMRMAFVEGPMRGEVTYAIEPEGGGARVSIRNCGGSSFAFPGLAWILRRSVGKDLERLAALAEAAGRS
jgi:hypothetical protein